MIKVTSDHEKAAENGVSREQWLAEFEQLNGTQG